MREELIELKKYLALKGVYKNAIGIDELPMMEGYCIYDSHSTIEVFYYERGQKMRIKSFHSITEAISYFKTLVLTDPTARK
jgi:hypothetical protein